MKSLVSVIIPMYNSQLYIERCISSILTQTYDQVEILVVDDGSIDNSADIIKKIQQENGKLKYFYQQNSGPGMARNKAIQESKGKYLLFVDADDYLSEDYIECMVESAEMNKSELVVAGYTLAYADARKQVQVVPEKYEKNVAEEWVYRISACCSRLYLKEFWLRNSLEFNEEKGARAEDVPIALYSNAMARNISIVKNAGYFYYQHQESAMHQKKKVIFQFPYRSFSEMYQKVKKQSFNNSEAYFNIGVIKFLAQFAFSIYRKADLEEKKRFKEYVEELLQEDWTAIIAEWKMYRRRIQFPILHKIAIELFLLKYK